MREKAARRAGLSGDGRAIMWTWRGAARRGR